jgi:type I restriction enzyme S subunit
LDRAEALRAKRRAALAQLDYLTQSIFFDLFGDPTSNEQGWSQVRLGDHTSKIGSGSTPTGGEKFYKETGIALIRSLNVRNGEFSFKDLAFIDGQQAAKLSNVIVDFDDILLNITGASVARVCRVPLSVLPARVNQHVSIIRPQPTLNAIFLEQFLLAPQTKRRLLRLGKAGATREAITKAQIEIFETICPPIELQRQFARRVTMIERLKESQRASLTELDALFNSLQHRAFRGEL